MKSALATVCLLAAALAVPLAPAVPAPQAVAADACGTVLARSTGGYWTCTFVDNFGGSRLDGNRWIGLNQPGSGDLCTLNSPRTIAVSMGKLRLSAIRTTSTVRCPQRADGTRARYAGATVSSYYRFSQQYGRFEARIKVRNTSLPGLHEAFWLWPDTRYSSDTNWPNSGEIDVMETYSYKPSLNVPFLHYWADTYGAVDGFNTSWSCTSQRGLWHTYVLEWSYSQLTIKVDGRTCLTSTHAAPSFRKRMILNLSQYLGGGSNMYDGRVSLPATMEVDWVKAWR
ncbi:MAG TPA: glycoside hydrolase family 16 protein [Nocardioides sp.]|nr:glycoside hydrolase family 16 protein [Nocardioides sp.]